MVKVTSNRSDKETGNITSSYTRRERKLRSRKTDTSPVKRKLERAEKAERER